MKLVKTGRLYIGCLSLLAPAVVFAQTPITTNESPESHAKTQQESSFWGSFTDQVKQTWDADNYELYVPLNTWHNRAMYDKEKTDRYNERPWGAGFGV
ncbi:MAG: phospholipid:lipid A palmitoyltransferase, partial [Enterobacterales bacterium]|nr:phospholipid:lipid A palmitoyltransferase [Enterobacterales bacterium]